jgi:hypothetical protein
MGEASNTAVMNTICSNVLEYSLGTGLPPIVMLFRAARILAGNIAISRIAKIRASCRNKPILINPSNEKIKMI